MVGDVKVKGTSHSRSRLFHNLFRTKLILHKGMKRSWVIVYNNNLLKTRLMAQGPVSAVAHARGSTAHQLRGHPWHFEISGHQTHPHHRQSVPKPSPCSYKYKDVQEQHIPSSQTPQTWVKVTYITLAGCSCVVETKRSFLKPVETSKIFSKQESFHFLLETMLTA